LNHGDTAKLQGMRDIHELARRVKVRMSKNDVFSPCPPCSPWWTAFS